MNDILRLSENLTKAKQLAIHFLQNRQNHALTTCIQKVRVNNQSEISENLQEMAFFYLGFAGDLHSTVSSISPPYLSPTPILFPSLPHSPTLSPFLSLSFPPSFSHPFSSYPFPSLLLSPFPLPPSLPSIPLHTASHTYTNQNDK